MAKRSWIWVVGLSSLAACEDPPCCLIVMDAEVEVAITTTRVGVDKPELWEIALACRNCLGENPISVDSVGLASTTFISIGWYGNADPEEPNALIDAVWISGVPETSDYSCNESGRTVVYDFVASGQPRPLFPGEVFQVSFDVTCESL